MFFLLRLLGLGKSFFSGIATFISSNIRWLLPLAAGIIIYFLAAHYITNIKKEAVQQGIKTEQVHEQTIIKQVNQDNRIFERRLGGVITTYAQATIKSNGIRIKQETIHTDTIKEIVKDNPIYDSCKLSQDIIDQRNLIRNLGPEPLVK